METTISQRELGLTDALNYDVFKNLTESNREKMVAFRTQTILNTKDEKGRHYYGIDKNDKRVFNVKATFTVIDFMLVEHGVLYAYMECQRLNANDIDVKVKSMEYKEL